MNISDKNQSIFELSLSKQTGALQQNVHELKQKYRQLWLTTAATFPEFPRTYSKREKKRIESETTKFLDELAEKQERQYLSKMNRGLLPILLPYRRK